MPLLQTAIQFIKKVGLLTFGQLVAILGIFFFFGLILYLFARFTRVTFVKSIGQKFDIYFTGWIGTPVHELGHALFCIPFGHRIVEMKLFSPNAANGSLGYVNHSYRKGNVWHGIGNFFIGFGPILFGSFVLFLLIKYLLPDNQALLRLLAAQKADLSTWAGLKQQLSSLYPTAKMVLQHLFSKANLHSWQFWVFLYLALCISSHMELSPPDLKGLWKGLVSIVVLFLVINCILVFFQINSSSYVGLISSYSLMLSGIFVFATIISGLFFISSFILLNVYTLIRYRKMFHPFA